MSSIIPQSFSPIGPAISEFINSIRGDSSPLPKARISRLGLSWSFSPSPTPLKFHDLNLKQDATFYRASGPMDKCNRVGRTITADPYKKACRLVRYTSFCNR